MSISQATYFGGSGYRAASTTVVLHAQDKRVQVIEPTGVIAVLLADATVLQTGWVQFVIINTSATDALLVGNATASALLGVVGPGQIGEFALIAKPNASGVWRATIGDYNSTPPPPPPGYGVWGSVEWIPTINASDIPAAVLLYDFVTDTSRQVADPVTILNKGASHAWSVQGDGHWVGMRNISFADTHPRFHRSYHDVDVFSSHSVPTDWDEDGSHELELTTAGAGEGIAGNGVGWSRGNCQEWDPTDTWTSLATQPLLPGEPSGQGSYASTARALQALLLSHAPNSSGGGNRQSLFDRPTQAYSAAPDNPFAAQHWQSNFFSTLDGDNAHIVGGNTTGGGAMGTLHFSYDMTLGVMGSWTVRASFLTTFSGTQNAPTMQSTADPTQAVRMIRNPDFVLFFHTTTMTFYSTISDTWSTGSTHTDRWYSTAYKGIEVQKA